MDRNKLIEICKNAMQINKGILIEVTIPNQDNTEYIINKAESVENKMNYYCKTYDENLIHSMNDKIKIVNVEIFNTDTLGGGI